MGGFFMPKCPPIGLLAAGTSMREGLGRKVGA